jgi:Terminase large subunit, T4likevirus-type, N-terminal/Terminase RNaseH-like domain
MCSRDGAHDTASVRAPGGSAGQLADGAEDVLVAGRGVDGGGVDALVPGDALDEADVVGVTVGVGESGVAEGVEVECVVEASTPLPFLEQRAEGAGGDALAAEGEEERSRGLDALAMGALPGDELTELVPGAVGEKDLLDRGLGGGALEGAQGDAAADPAVLVQDVADIKGGELVLAEGGAEGEREEDMVAKPVTMLTGDLEQASLLDGCEGAGRADDGGDVRGHHKPPSDTDAPLADESKPNLRGPLVIGKRSEEDLLDWLGTELGFLTGIGHYNEEPLMFEPYQVAFLRSTRRYRWVEKARQVGFSFLFACEAVARCHLRDAHTAVMVSYNLEDAKEKVNYARQIAEELPLAFRKKLITDSKTELGFLSNGASKRISRIISNPSKAPRGKKGDIYLDELAHYANDREVYKGSTALILRSRGQLTGCSSPLGRRGVFWEIAKEELRKYRAYWRQRVPWWLCRFFSTDVPRAAKEAPLLPTEERVRTFGSKDIQDQFDSLPLEDFQGEFENSYCDESYSFYPYELILPCTSDDLVLADDFATFGEVEGRLVAGFDVGRKRDLSELTIFEETDGKKVCRLIRSYDRVPFAEQEADLRRMLTTLTIGRLSIDQNGIGMHLAENLRRDFGQVVPETFTNESKEIWANDFKILLQRKDVVLPKDRELVAQIHSVKRRLTPSGKPSFEVERDEVGRGHADRFWSVALACRKERGPVPGAVPEIQVRVIG